MNPGSIKRTTVPTRRAEARALFRNAIIDAAEQVIGERGYHAARIHDIADRARTAVGTVYNHFATKEDVLRALLEERTEALSKAFEQAPGEPASFQERMTLRISRILAYVDEHRSFFAIAFDHGLFGGTSPNADNALGGKPLRYITRVKSALSALIREGIDAGVLVDQDPARLARFLGGTIRGFIVGGLQDGLPRIQDEAPIIVALFLHGAGRPARKSR